MLLKPYRCGKCKRQFWRFDFKRSTVLLIWTLYVIILAAIAEFTWIVLNAFAANQAPNP